MNMLSSENEKPEIITPSGKINEPRYFKNMLILTIIHF